MRATIRDVRASLTPRNITVIVAILCVSFLMLEVLGYLIWRRFPTPSLIVAVAVLAWKIGRRIGHPGLARVLNAASVGLGVFGLCLLAAAVIDGWYFPLMGYVSWTVQITMWGWIAFHVWRAHRVLKGMPPDRLLHVTDGAGDIYAEMTFHQHGIKTALEQYDNLHFAHN